MIRCVDLDALLVAELPELAADRAEYDRRRQEDAEFRQSFFSYSFVPTLQAALDRHIEPFCAKAFSLLERLVAEGDGDLQTTLQDEFFGYGPACEKWMRRALPWMGPQTRELAEKQNSERTQ